MAKTSAVYTKKKNKIKLFDVINYIVFIIVFMRIFYAKVRLLCYNSKKKTGSNQGNRSIAFLRFIIVVARMSYIEVE